MKKSYLLSVIFASSLSLSTAGNAQHSQTYQMQYYPIPKPITEDILKQRLNAQLMFTKQQLAFDKKQADLYAANFAKYQKQQASALKKIMDTAEQQRQYTINVLEIQQHRIIQQFTKFQIANDSKK